MTRDKVAGIEIETSLGNTDLHIYPRETRRGKAQWGMWIQSDGSAIIFVGRDQIFLPKNSAPRSKHVAKEKNGQIVYQEVNQYPD